MAATPTLKGRITTDINPFKAALAKAKSAGLGFAKGMGRLLLSGVSTPLLAIGGLIAGAFAFSKFVGGIKGAFEVGRGLHNMSARTGIAVSQLIVLQEAFKAGGLAASDVGRTINKMQKSIASGIVGGDMDKAFRKIGIDAKELKGLAPEQQFAKIGRAINSLPQGEKITAAMKIFGRSGGRLLAVFEGGGGGMKAAAEAVGSQAQLLEKNSDIFNRITIRLNRTGLKMQGFYVGVASVLAPAVDNLTAAFDKIDVANFGVMLGNAIREAAKWILGAFADPAAAADLVAASLALGYAMAGNFLAENLAKVALGFSSAMLTGMDVVVRAMRAGLEMAIDKVLSKIPGMGVTVGTFDDYAKNQGPTMLGKMAGQLNAIDLTKMLIPTDGIKATMIAAAAKIKVAGEAVVAALEYTVGKTKEAAKPWETSTALSNRGGLQGASMAMVVVRSPRLQIKSRESVYLLALLQRRHECR